MDFLRHRSAHAWAPISMSRVANDLAVTFLPALAGAVALYYWAPEELNAMEGIVYPTVFFFVTLLAVLFVREIVPFLGRALMGKPARDKPRSLRNVNRRAMEALEDQLRSDQMRISEVIAHSWVCYTNDVDEEEGFAKEIATLLDRCGWRMMDCGQGACGGYVKRPTDIEIYLPDGGSAGLILLHELLIKSGYRSVLREGGGIGHACIQVGPPTH